MTKNKYLTSDYINICFCSDVNLIEFIPTVINSILQKNKGNIKIHYINNIRDKSKILKLKNYIKRFPNLKFYNYYNEWNHKYNGLSHITEATMLRLFIPELIKESKIIYLDIDIIVNTNLLELYNIDCGDIGIGLKDSIHQKWEKIFDDDRKSGNCGIIIMNLDTLRKNKFTTKCLKLHKKYSNRHDQFIINLYCNGKHKKLPVNFNVFLYQDDYIINKNKNFILHYVGKNKPYYTNTGKYQYLWDEVDFNNILKIGHKIFKNKNITYNKLSRHNFKNIKPHYFLCGFVNLLNIQNIIEIGTYKGDLTLSIRNGIKHKSYKIITCDVKEFIHAKERLKHDKNIIRLIGDTLNESFINNIKNIYHKIKGNFILFIDALKYGKWIEQILNKYLLKRVKYVFFNNISINNEMKRWWTEFTSNKNNIINLNDYLGNKVTKNGLGYWIIK